MLEGFVGGSIPQVIQHIHGEPVLLSGGILRYPGQKSSWTLPQLPNGITPGDVIYIVVDMNGEVHRPGSCVW